MFVYVQILAKNVQETDIVCLGEEVGGWGIKDLMETQSVLLLTVYFLTLRNNISPLEK